MYQIGDKIVYGGEGVCLVEAVGPLDIPGSSQERLYYTLAPLYRSGRIYAPVDSTVCSRPSVRAGTCGPAATTTGSCSSPRTAPAWSK